MPRLVLLSEAVRAVILPATPLLVPGLVPGRSPDPLAEVREAVAAALARLIAASSSLPLVLAPGPVPRHGRLRPSLAGSGIGDRWLPDDRTGRSSTYDDLPAAGTGASVALLALAGVLGARTGEIETIEVPPDGTGPEGSAAQLLRRATCLVVAGGGPAGGSGAMTDGIRAALCVAGADAWTADHQVFERSSDHLPLEYRVTVLT